MFRKIKELLLNWAIKEMLSPVDLTKVLTCEEKTGVLKLGGEQLSDLEVQELKGEVAAFTRFKLFNIYHETLRQKAIEKGFYQSTDAEQVLAGKMMLHSLSIQKMILEAVKRSKVFNPIPDPFTRK
jgi:hypothetical protein